jgi:hypothetical protein
MWSKRMDIAILKHGMRRINHVIGWPSQGPSGSAFYRLHRFSSGDGACEIGYHTDSAAGNPLAISSLEEAVCDGVRPDPIQ